MASIHPEELVELKDWAESRSLEPGVECRFSGLDLGAACVELTSWRN